MANTMNGTIKRLVGDKGFGFILASDGNEYFATSRRATAVRSAICAKGRT